MKYVYLLQSIPHPDQHYVGLTSNVEARLASHNAGQSTYTAKYRPWKIITYHAFADEAKAAAFEKYLKPAPAAPLRKGTYYHEELVRRSCQPPCPPVAACVASVERRWTGWRLAKAGAKAFIAIRSLPA